MRGAAASADVLDLALVQPEMSTSRLAGLPVEKDKAIDHVSELESEKVTMDENVSSLKKQVRELRVDK